MKRWRWMALVAILALVAAACGGDDGDTEDTASETTAGESDTTMADTTMSDTTMADTTEGDTEGEASGDLMSVSADGCDYGGQIESIEATASNEVVFSLCKTDPAFLAKLAFNVFGIQPSEHLEATGGSPLDNPVGTGPFQLDVWDRGSEIVFSRNDNYWGEAPAFDTLVFRWATESTARILELQSGNANYITNLAASDYETIDNDDNLVLLEDPNPNVFYMGFTNTFEPWNDPLVRQAISLGIDRQRIVDTFYPDGSEVADYFTPCSIPNGCEGEAFPDFDPEAARDLLAEAGYPDGFDTTIFYRDVFRVYLPEPSAVATEIQTQLAENLNITAEVQEQESGAFIEAASAGDLDGIHLLGWGADYPHVTNFLDFHFAGNPQFGDPYEEIVDLLAEGAGTIDEAEAAPIYEQVNTLLVEQVPMVPIAHGAAADAALSTLENAQVPPFGAPQFATMVPASDTLVFYQNAEPISLYCADETDGESLSACEQVIEGLYGYDLEGTPVPRLAEECVANDDGTQWTCTLREGVTFHDGSEFDANDVVASFAAGIDAGNPLHVGNTGAFTYYEYLWGGLMNNEG